MSEKPLNFLMPKSVRLRPPLYLNFRTTLPYWSLQVAAIGGVAPFGWISPATILIDEALNDYEVVWAAAGHPHTVFPTSFDELIAATNAKRMVVGY